MDNKSSEAYIWYLFHSGFAVKTPGHLLVFDYYLDKPKGINTGLDNGVINPKELSDLNVVVFSSHQHMDHFNPVVFNWAKHIKKIRYILSYDIEHNRKNENIISVQPGSDYNFEDIQVSTLKSTDEGVAFLISCNGLTIYHAGDLNWWHWEGEPDDENLSMAENYKRQIDLLKGKHIDIAFVPLDPRLEGHYLLGLDYFMKTVGAEMVFPMHFGTKYSIFSQLRKDSRAAGYIEKTAVITRRGQKFVYNY